MTMWTCLNVVFLLYLVAFPGRSGGDALRRGDEAVAASVPASRQPSDPVLVGAGDIASCDDLSGAIATSKLIATISGTVFAAGNLAYPDGS